MAPLFLVAFLSFLVGSYASPGIIFEGGDPGDQTGWSISSAGDMNHDGIWDFIVGAPSADGGRGKAYVIYGRENFPGRISLSDLTGLGFAIKGPEENQTLGYSVTGYADLNQDGWYDVVVAAPFASAPNFYFNDTSNLTEEYPIVQGGVITVVWGRNTTEDPFPPELTIEDDLGLWASRINGSADFGFLGWSMTAQVDLNGDGGRDLVVGAPGIWLGEGNVTADGVVHVFFGVPNWYSSVPATNADLIILGPALEGSQVGYAVAGIPDINGDGYEDLIFSAPFAMVNVTFNAGAFFVIYGGPNAVGIIDLANLQESQGFLVLGDEEGGQLGLSVAGGDVNNDGFGDAVASTLTGQVVVLFGRNGTENPFPLVTMVSEIDGTNGFIIEGSASDNFGASLAVNWVNDDMYPDILIGSTAATVDSEVAAGVVTAIWGASSFDPVVNISMLTPTTGAVYVGDKRQDGAGSALAILDINGDTYNDVLIGADAASPKGKLNAGTQFVVFGTNLTVLPQINLGELSACDLPPTLSLYPFSTIGTCTNFPYQTGDTCNLGCFAGMQPINGSFVATCGEDGSWKLDGTFCDPVACDALELPNGVDMSKADAICTNGMAFPGDICNFECLPGYIKSGSAMCQGVAQGSSVFVSDAACQPTFCDPVSLPVGVVAESVSAACTNGSAIPGDVCTYECMSGYIHSGTTVCTGHDDTSSWTDTQTCTPAPCGTLNLPAGAVNMSAACTNPDAILGSVCTFDCQVGMSHSGHSNCVANGPGKAAWVSDQTCTETDGCIGNSCSAQGDNNARCLDITSPGVGYTCSCSAGFAYSSAQGTCSDMNGCLQHTNCQSNGDHTATCEDVPAPGSGYTCVCSKGYSFNTVTGSCTVVNNCIGNTCGKEGDIKSQCHNNGTDYSCVCSQGFMEVDHVCVDIDGCLGNTCKANGDAAATCKDNPAPGMGYQCGCSAGFMFNASGGSCYDIDDCDGNSCALNGDTGSTCVQYTAPATGYYCECTTGYVDKNGVCLDINDCLNVKCNSSGDVGSKCIDNKAPQTGYTCQCSNGFAFENGTCEKTAIPPTSPCGISDTCDDNALCIDGEDGHYTCECNDGYQGDGSVCTDIPACDYFPCDDHATCTDVVGGPNSTEGRTCKCIDGYYGTGGPLHCADIPACKFFPCVANAICTRLVGGPNSTAGRTCECLPGFVLQGDACVVADENDKGDDGAASTRSPTLVVSIVSLLLFAAFLR